MLREMEDEHREEPPRIEVGGESGTEGSPPGTGGVVEEAGMVPWGNSSISPKSEDPSRIESSGEEVGGHHPPGRSDSSPASRPIRRKASELGRSPLTILHACDHLLLS